MSFYWAWERSVIFHLLLAFINIIIITIIINLLLTRTIPQFRGLTLYL